MELILNEWIEEHLARYLDLVKERLSLDKEVNLNWNLLGYIFNLTHPGGVIQQINSI